MSAPRVARSRAESATSSLSARLRWAAARGSKAARRQRLKKSSILARTAWSAAKAAGVRSPRKRIPVVAPAGEGVRLGEVVEVRSGSSGGFEPLTVVGLVDLQGQPDLRSSLPLFVTAEQVGVWASQGAGGDVRVAAADGVDDDELLHSLRAGLDPVDGSELFSYTTGDAAGTALASSFMGARSMYVTVLYAFTVVAVAVAALVIASTFAVLFAARRERWRS